MNREPIASLLPLARGGFEKMRGPVEADETFVGGKVKNMHKGRRKMLGGHYGKTIVMGLLDRTRRKVGAKVVGDTTRSALYPVIRANVEPGSEVMTDALMAYRNLQPEYVHEFVDHTVAYVCGKVHTNGLENFWALVKRAIRSTYVSVAPVNLMPTWTKKLSATTSARGRMATDSLKRSPSPDLQAAHW